MEEITAVTMQCLWRWATAKAAKSADEPVTLRRVRGLGCAHLEGLQVGGHCQPPAWDPVCSLGLHSAEGSGSLEPPPQPVLFLWLCYCSLSSVARQIFIIENFYQALLWSWASVVCCDLVFKYFSREWWSPCFCLGVLEID